jgi:LmbE family N-acetylglucosaminyl deacetylase
MRVLVISAHTDDAELAAGGTISGLRNVYGYVPTFYHFTHTQQECIKSWKCLNIKKVRGVSEDHHAREIERQRLLEDLVFLRQVLKPSLVITHGSKDVHQAHKTVYEESVRAFKHCSILGYNHPWNCVNGSNDNYFVKLKQGEVDNKMKALDCYESQKQREYFNRDYQVSAMKATGLLVGSEYAEGFELIRWMQ